MEDNGDKMDLIKGLAGLKQWQIDTCKELDEIKLQVTNHLPTSIKEIRDDVKHYQRQTFYILLTFVVGILASLIKLNL